MPLNQPLLPEFDHEMAATRKLIERLPADSGAIGTAYRRAFEEGLAQDPRRRRQVLALWLVRCGATDVGRELVSLPGHDDLVWAPQWAANGNYTAAAIFMVTQGLQGGYNALLGAALVGQKTDTANWEAAARQAGITQQTIDSWKQSLNPENLRAEAQDPQNIAAARQTAMIVSWATLVGTLLSIATAVLGALAGMGPTFRLFPAAVVSAHDVEVRTTTPISP